MLLDRLLALLFGFLTSAFSFLTRLFGTIAGVFDLLQARLGFVTLADDLIAGFTQAFQLALSARQTLLQRGHFLFERVTLSLQLFQTRLHGTYLALGGSQRLGRFLLLLRQQGYFFAHGRQVCFGFFDLSQTLAQLGILLLDTVELAFQPLDAITMGACIGLRHDGPYHRNGRDTGNPLDAVILKQRLHIRLASRCVRLWVVCF